MLNSVLLQNITTLRESLRNKVSHIDVNAFNIKDGSITVSNQDCIIQKLKIWLQSDEFDYYRKPFYGGFLTRNVVKRPFTEDNCEIIKNLLVTEISELFPSVEVLKADVKCNFSEKRWEIRLAIFDKELGVANYDLERDPIFADVL